MGESSARQRESEQADTLVWEGDSMEDFAVLAGRNDNLPPCSNILTATSTLGHKSNPARKSSKQRRRELVRSINVLSPEDHTPDPEISHRTTQEETVERTPLRHFMHPHAPSNTHHNIDNALPESLKKGKVQLLHLLNAKEGLKAEECYDWYPRQGQQREAKRNSRKSSTLENDDDEGNDTDDMSTASTSGSNSSCSTSAGREKSTESTTRSVISGKMDTDQELELYSRQIRIELRQAEMKELAEEAERAAASGQKRFTGRASTFRDDEVLELTAASSHKQSGAVSSNKKVKETPLSQRKLARALDFGTPLVKRLQPEPAKISVVALRDVAEVVPSFKDFHMHLRTHFLRRRVVEKVLIFNESDGDMKSVDGLQAKHEHNVVDMWKSFNFSTWTSSKRCMGDNGETGEAVTDVETHHTEESSTAAAVGELLAGHVHKSLDGFKDMRRPRVQVPPGLGVFDKESYAWQPNESTDNESDTAEDKKSSSSDDATTQTPSSPDRVKDVAQRTSEACPSSTRASEHHSTPPRDQDIAKPPLQDGSPTSPIIVEDLDDNNTSEDGRGRVYKGPDPPPGLPVTPKGNFRSVFDSNFSTPKYSRLQKLIATRIADTEEEFLGPDFVTPVRLRDIRDDKSLEERSFSSNLPTAPFVSNPSKSYFAVDTPNSICDYGGASNSQNLRTSCEGSHLHRPGAPRYSNSHLRLAERSLPGDYGNSLMQSLFKKPGETISPLAVDESLHVSLDFLHQGEAKIQSRREPTSVVINLEGYESERSDPDGKHYSDGEKCDKPDRRLCQSASMPTLRRRYTHDDHDYLAVKQGKSNEVPTVEGVSYEYDLSPLQGEAHQTFGEATIGTRAVAEIENQGTIYFFKHDNFERGSATVGDPQEAAQNANPNEYQQPPLVPNEISMLVIDFDGIDKFDLQERDSATSGGSKCADESKATADFGCECLISPASSLDSEEGVIKKAYSNWRLMEHGTLARTESQHRSLQAAVAMFSRMSPSGSRRLVRNVVYASSKDNDDFLSNYLYCSKTDDVTPNPEPICSGSAPCQDTKMPCGEIAVDSCVGNFLDSAWKFFPRRSSEGKKLLSLSREDGCELQSKHISWYDIANERFDRLLERLIGDHRTQDQNRLFYQAPTLKERKTPRQGTGTPPRYDDDLGAVVYVKSSGSELNASHSYSSGEGLQREQRVVGNQLNQETRNRQRCERDCQLYNSQSDMAQLHNDSLDQITASRCSM